MELWWSKSQISQNIKHKDNIKKVIAKTDIMDNLVKRQFKKYGYVILDNVIDSDSVQALRSIIEDKSKISSSERMLTIGDIVTCKELLILQFNTAIVDAVHKIFENPTYINDLQIQVNIFCILKKFFIWFKFVF